METCICKGSNLTLTMEDNLQSKGSCFLLDSFTAKGDTSQTFAPIYFSGFFKLLFPFQGCVASVLLNSTSSNQAEKAAVPDQTRRGFNFIVKVKSLLEAQCPGVVSSAAIIASIARDTVVTIGGPSWSVSTGRRDVLISNYTEATNNIPTSTSNFMVCIPPTPKLLNLYFCKLNLIFVHIT
ncbi:hypothetical protein NE237_012787 [Protea cynaroides]|uniref:Plant heme peroxidase family profile domain-containing protein n=1 Tax=Protea cynaroides TaxID=273540 RepID=A0A9Q0H2J7_9MAGN|nr:hypothetical protein NE237_012787 [Protea cynaroides]